jgi:hypothetical protein
MNAHENRVPNTMEGLATFRFIQSAAGHVAPRRFPPGVYKHRSIEALNAQTEAWRRDPSTFLPPPPRDRES